MVEPSEGVGRIMRLEKDTPTRVTVSIFDQEYVVRSREEAEYVRMLSEIVDQRMREIKHKSPHLSTVKVAVLTALNLAHELMKVQEDYEGLVNLIEEAKRR